MASSLPTDAIARVADVRRSFGAKVVLDGFTLEVARGEVIGLHGGNGSGKTTALRCLAGTLTVDSGRVEVLGSSPLRAATRARIGASLGARTGLVGALRGHENLLFHARLRLGWRPARAAVAEIESELGLERMLRVRADRCSAGMASQLELARVLLGDPDLILLDEPTRSLDDEARERMWRALRARSSAGVVIASHRADDLGRCDRVVDLAG